MSCVLKSVASEILTRCVGIDSKIEHMSRILTNLVENAPIMSITFFRGGGGEEIGDDVDRMNMSHD